MANKPKGHKQPRDNETGQLASPKDMERNPKRYNNEVIPFSGNGDTGRGKKQK